VQKARDGAQTPGLGDIRPPAAATFPPHPHTAERAEEDEQLKDKATWSSTWGVS